ncbi:hypothetical protein CBR_g40530 [Chara braunii]|uniref:CCHC-type domain-containing protein n=1 Tax=Chara braunii TaxID=69332 RepID=A0A388K1Z8_CHABU|nr:hypothetical protein CBR_g40530 [Chara braunii]|eukprot:GBG64082.1 hypothetical protein CBR_g40530 [Chara braunii]
MAGQQQQFGGPPLTYASGAQQTIAGGGQHSAVMCYICGKQGHYARNCWAAGNGRPTQQFQQQSIQQPVDDETAKMKAYFRKKIQKQKVEEERRERIEEGKRREEEDRREADRLREAEAREAKLEAKLIRLMNQHNKSVSAARSSVVKKKSPRTKAWMLREMRSYFDESEDDSEEVREEAERLVNAIENRKGKRRMNEVEGRVSAARMRSTRNAPIDVDDLPDEEKTPVRKRGEATGGDFLELALEMHEKLSAKKVTELRKICNEEGVEWTRKEVAMNELVRCRTSYDVKDMFARLSHDAVLNSVLWMIELYRRRNLVGVRASRRGRVCMMARNRRSEDFVLLDFELMTRAIQFELNNAFVTSAGETLRQVFRIPVEELQPRARMFGDTTLPKSANFAPLQTTREIRLQFGKEEEGDGDEGREKNGRGRSRDRVWRER